VTGLGVPGWTNKAIKGDRWFTWAKFETTSGRQFFAVAGHLPVGNSATVVKVRAEESRMLVPVLDALAGKLPMVLGADMNGDATRDPKPAQVSFISKGWFDAAAVPAKKLRSNMKVSTANGSGKQIGAKDPGYGSKPVRHPYETSRIDYILLRNSPYTFGYTNVLYLHSNGTFIKSLQGTDHNMQLATIGIGNPVG
jgi:endonuclease/exonuclease/phosphatase family metal-dependent hydrolase